MFEFYYQTGSRRRKLHRNASDRCVIGSARDSDLHIDMRGVAKRHAELIENNGDVFIRDLGTGSGTWVNRSRVREYGPLTTLDEIIVGEISISFHRAVGDKQKHPASTTDQLVGSDSLNVEISDSETYCNYEDGGSGISQQVGNAEELLYWSKIVHDEVLSGMDLRRKDVGRMSDQQLRDETAALIDDALETLASELPESMDLDLLRRNVLNEAVGLGPLEFFLNDDAITEIMVNNSCEIFVEKSGKLEKSSWTFSSNEAVFSVIERIITPIGRRIDESSPIVDARLKDGSRVNAVIPPLALKGPSLTIRKFPKKRLEFSDLVEYGSVDERMAEFLRICVEMRRNAVVSGGTGSGKTTLLNVLSNFIPDGERIVTIEDAAELKLVQPNLVSLESRPANLEGRGGITIRDLVKNALRMRPDRIVVGECRGGEAIDMLQAMNTGHDGSLTTVHANNPRDVISRLEVLVLMAGMDLPVSAIREQIASAVNLIIQQTRFPCGSRKITRVTEVVGMESSTVQLQDIFIYRQNGRDKDGRVRGRFEATGFIPSFYEELAEHGYELDFQLFRNEGSVVAVNRDSMDGFSTSSSTSDRRNQQDFGTDEYTASTNHG